MLKSMSNLLWLSQKLFFTTLTKKQDNDKKEKRKTEKRKKERKKYMWREPL